MDNIYDKCRNIILKYVDIKDEEIIDVLTVAVMGLFSFFDEKLLENLPKYIEGLTVERINIDNIVLNIDAVYDDDQTCADKVLYFPNEGFEGEYTEAVIKTIFELIHLIRFKGVFEKNGDIELKNGLASRRIILDSLAMQDRGFELENAITSYFAKEIFINLKSLLDGEDDYGLSTEHYEDISNHKYYLYDIRTHLIGLFMEDEKFKELIMGTFTSDDPKYFSKHYNHILENDAAYSKLLKLFSDLTKSLNEEDEDLIGDVTKKILMEIEAFKSKPKRFMKD